MLGAPTQDHPRRSRFSRSLLAVALLGALVGFVPNQPVTAADGDIGFEGPAFPSAAGEVTGEKPESKLWWNDGTWWASMWDATLGGYRIHRLNVSSQAWVSTGVAIDTRADSRADALWDGSKLYVASHVFSENAGVGTAASAPRLWRYSYSPTSDAYTLDAGFPVVISAANDRVEALTIAKDSTGQLWATWTRGGAVYVTQTTNAAQTTWGTPASINDAPVASDDISAVVSFGSNIGILWSNQRTTAGSTSFYFATHADSAADAASTWSPDRTATTGPSEADDHINLKLQSSGGTIYAAVKTSSSTARLLLLTFSTSSGTWSRHVHSRGAEGLTRPQILINQTAGTLHYFASDEGGGGVYEKVTSLASPTFGTGAGKGTPVMVDASSADINNVTTTKQTLTSATGLVALASNDRTHRYWHHYDALGGGVPDERVVTRLAGADRYATAAAVSRANFPGQAPTVFVATGAGFADALSAGPGAGAARAPLLLVQAGSIPAATAAELDRLNPGQIYVVGGPAVIAQQMDQALRQYTSSQSIGSVQRLAGADRYATAAEVSALLPDNRSSVFVASGTGFPDALAAGTAATRRETSVLLVKPDAIPTHTATELERMSPATIYVVGGPNSVSEAVRSLLARYTDNGSLASVVRLGGADRYETAVEVARATWDSGSANPFVATGRDFPDALSGGAYPRPLYLVDTNSVPPSVSADIGRLDPDAIQILGGPMVVSPGVEQALARR